MSEEQRGMLAQLEQGLDEIVKQGRITVRHAQIISKQWSSRTGEEIEKMYYEVQSSNEHKQRNIDTISEALKSYMADGTISEEAAKDLKEAITTCNIKELQDIIYDMGVDYPNIPDSLLSLSPQSNVNASKMSCASNR